MSAAEERRQNGEDRRRNAAVDALVKLVQGRLGSERDAKNVLETLCTYLARTEKTIPPVEDEFTLPSGWVYAGGGKYWNGSYQLDHLRPSPALVAWKATIGARIIKTGTLGQCLTAIELDKIGVAPGKIVLDQKLGYVVDEKTRAPVEWNVDNDWVCAECHQPMPGEHVNCTFKLMTREDIGLPPAPKYRKRTPYELLRWVSTADLLNELTNRGYHGGFPS